MLDDDVVAEEAGSFGGSGDSSGESSQSDSFAVVVGVGTGIIAVLLDEVEVLDVLEMLEYSVVLLEDSIVLLDVCDVAVGASDGAVAHPEMVENTSDVVDISELVGVSPFCPSTTGGGGAGPPAGAA